MDSLVNAVFIVCFLVPHVTLSIATVNCTYGDIRLYNGTTPNEGDVQICDDNEWSGVCDYAWACADATVACRQLGYKDTTALVYTGSYFGEWNTVDFGAYTCSGTETNLIDCSYYMHIVINTIHCNSQKLAGVRCQLYTKECKNGEIRLVGGESSSEGRLEMCYTDIWTPVCVTYFHDEEAAVACKQLGYTQYSWGSIFTAGNTPLVKQYIIRFDCSADFSESTLTECSVTLTTRCTKYCDSVRLKCFNPPQCEEGSSRLVNGTIEQEGRLEVCVNGVWGTVCSSGWNVLDAYVACKQLGKGNSNRGPLVWYNSNQFTDGDYPIVVSNAVCGGWERTITDCTHHTYGEFDCARTQVIGIQCYDDCEDGDIRLTGSRNREHEGTVEICVDSLWGVIADSGWGQVDANIVCSQLGYDTTGIRAFNNSFYGKPKRPININNVACTGSEKRLLDCSHYEFSDDDKKSLQKLVDVAGVRCSEGISEETAPTVITVMSSSPTAADFDDSGSSSSTRTPNYSAINGGVYLTLIVVIIMSIIFIIMGYVIYKKFSQNHNSILNAVKNESYTSVNVTKSPTSPKPTLPSRNKPPLDKVKVHYKPNEYHTPCVNDKEEDDIEVYTELS